MSRAGSWPWHPLRRWHSAAPTRRGRRSPHRPRPPPRYPLRHRPRHPLRHPCRPWGPSVAATEPAGEEEGADPSVSGTPHPAGPAARGRGETAGAAVRETFDHAVTVTNDGPSDARQVTVTDHLPSSLEIPLLP
ncbi:hypothetical protein ACFXGI_05210 [Streptomyces sp. NPDC059355]|uniref:hypothetical protein n=1 Tax=Streptomyces sp. NPDC059355 TaxID=3346811 RepID=UPI003688DAA3